MNTDILDTALTKYLENNCEEESPLLKRINRETYLKETLPHMISGHYQGRLLAMISKLVSPQRILEIGTFTGYATLCLAEGLKEGGQLHTIDINEELAERVQGYFDDSAYKKQIHYHLGNAVDIIPGLGTDFDLIFIDADKKNNLLYFNMLLDSVKSGSLFLIDNVLWKGKVFDHTPDKQTREIIDMNNQLAADPRVEKLILPIRDGIYLLRKK